MRVEGRRSGFTLIELLVVISIIAALAGILVPAIKNFGRADATAAASRQLLDDIGRARQLALSQRTPVYMVFLPADFWNLPGYSTLYSKLPKVEKDKADRLFDKQLNSYALVALRGVGDQPGRHQARYLSPWKSLPEGNFIAQWKFMLRDPVHKMWIVDAANNPIYGPMFGFNVTNTIPFPSEDAAATTNLFVDLPYIVFDYNGQVRNDDDELRKVKTDWDEFIPLARGTIGHALDPETKVPVQQVPSVSENPPGNSTNSFNLVHIDWLTGRAKVERPQIQ